MKKIFFAFLLILLSVSGANAQLLWKITSKGMKQPSYLFGTHHLIPIQFLDSVPGVYKAFNRTDMVIGEMVLEDEELQSKISEAGTLTDGITMADLLSAEDYELVDTELQSVLSLGLKDLSLMHPAFIRNMYQLEVFKKATGYTLETQLDTYFQLVAVEKGKPVVGLESAEMQLKMLLPDSDLKLQAQGLVESVKNKHHFEEGVLILDKIYRSGDIEGMAELVEHEDDETMIDNRNMEWVKILPEYINVSPCFIAVGSGHLGGENGVIKLLRKQGYKVTPVKK